MRYSIQLCLLSIVILCLTENLVTNATKGRLDEQSDLCSDYEPRHPIPEKQSDPIPKNIVIPLVGISVGTTLLFGAPFLLGLFGFKTAGIAAGSAAAFLQSLFYAGSIPAGSWFAFFQAKGMTGIVITKGTAISLGTISSGMTFYWYGSDKAPSSEAEWYEMEKKCNDCVINRIDCRWAKERLFEQLEREKSNLGWFSLIQKEKLNDDENWESFVRLSCRCFPIFKNKLKEGEGSHEKELASLFNHYVPYFYLDDA